MIITLLYLNESSVYNSKEVEKNNKKNMEIRKG